MNLFLVLASIVDGIKEIIWQHCLEVRREGGGLTLFFHISSRKKKRIALGAYAGSNLFQAPPMIGCPSP